MIFAETYKQVLSGQKTCTTRVRYRGDTPGAAHGCAAVLARTATGWRPRWIAGHVYAVQPGRCHHAVGHILVSCFAAVDDPTIITPDVAAAEGFGSCEEFLDVWHQLHQKTPKAPCWRLWFRLVEQIGGSL